MELTHLLHGDGHNVICLNGSFHALKSEYPADVTCERCKAIVRGATQSEARTIPVNGSRFKYGTIGWKRETVPYTTTARL